MNKFELGAKLPRSRIENTCLNSIQFCFSNLDFKKKAWRFIQKHKYLHSGAVRVNAFFSKDFFKVMSWVSLR